MLQEREQVSPSGGGPRFPPVQHDGGKSPFLLPKYRSSFGPQFPLTLLTFSVGLMEQIALDFILSGIEV